MADPASEDFPAPVVTRRRRRRISWIWLVPIVAAIAGASLVVRAWMQAGPRITISFETANGLEVGRTQIRYKDVTVGVVSGIRLDEDWSRVIVTADIAKDAAALAREGTRFWVVRPRLALSGVSGLGTLLSGAYIEVDTPGDTPHLDRPAQTAFEGLENPPEITHGRPGRRFVLEAADLGSLEIGSPVYYRRINVGRVVDYELADDGRSVQLQVFIESPYDRYVTGASRFWNASGVDMAIGADGLRLRTQSLVSLALGGIAFENFDGPGDTTSAEADARYHLYTGEAVARAVPQGQPVPIRMRFDQSIRGLSVGAPVDFKGIQLGQVTHITMDFDDEKRSFFVLVDADLYLQRLGAVYERIEAAVGPHDSDHAVFEPMVRNGMRAQLRTANLLTGQLYVVLDTFPDAARAELPDTDPLVIPTVGGEFDQLQQQIGSIVAKLEKLPLEEIAKDLRGTLASTTRLINRLDKQVAPEAQAMMQQATRSLADVAALLATDAPLPLNTERAMQELSRAARSLRILADYLQANPEALIRGRGPDGLPTGATRN